jgi:hypothetical protein
MQRTPQLACPGDGSMHSLPGSQGYVCTVFVTGGGETKQVVTVSTTALSSQR